MAHNADESSIVEFSKNPLDFITKGEKGYAVISSDNILGGPSVIIGDVGYFKFEKDPNHPEFKIKYHGPEASAGTVSAYYLGYNGGAQTSWTPAQIDIPKINPEHKLLFTGSLSGCSVIVTNLNDNQYRVYHDSRLDSSLLGKPQLGNGRIVLYIPLLEENPPDIIGAEPLIEMVPKSYNPELVQSRFDKNREKCLERLRDAHTKLSKGPPKGVDGKFQPFKDSSIKLDNEAVGYSEGLRNDLDVIKKNKRNSSTHHAELIAQLNAQDLISLSDELFVSESLKLPMHPSSKREFLYLTRTMTSSQKYDYTYLWLKQKEAKGFAAVVREGEHRQAPLGDTAGERLSEQRFRELLAGDNEFSTGYKTYALVEISGYEHDMTLSQMIQLFDRSSTSLTQTEQGALLRRIELARKELFNESIWQKTNDVIDMFQDRGGYTKPMPQDILLHAIPDEHGGGRCYPLVYAMSVALASSDFAIDQLCAKLVGLSPNNESDMKNAKLLKRCLKDLHTSYPAAEASRPIGKMTLAEAVSMLEKSIETTTLAMHTEVHAMLQGLTKNGNSTSWHFYDPNFAIATFKSGEALLEATTKFFGESGFAKVYEAQGQTPSFDFFQIDAERVSRIGFDHNLTVADLVQPETLLETIASEHKTAIFLQDPAQLTSSRTFSAQTELLEILGLGEAAWRDATARLEESTGMGEHWMPILETMKEGSEKGSYEVQFINLKNKNETKWISTESHAIKDFKARLDEHLKTLSKTYEFESGSFMRKENLAHAEAIDGLNAMLIVKTLIEHFSSKKTEESKTNAELADALKIHSYLNLTQMGHQTLGDVGKMVNLVKAMLETGQVAKSSLPTLVKGLGYASEGFGVLLGGANVVLDAYELAHRDNDAQRAVFGPQLAFDSVTFLSSVGTIGAGFIGATTAVAVLGGVSVILGGLAFGVGALASGFAQIVEKAQAVGCYFGDADKAYRAGGFKYDENQKILVPLFGAVISEIDAAGDVKFDSQYIYRTRHGSTGSGRSNYFFWAADFPRMIHDKSQAIHVREGIRAPASGKLANTRDYTAIILPATPKSYISYEWQILPLCTSRYDYGFDVIRRLEEDERFDYDFYIFPSEYIIHKITHEFVKTPIVVKLDSRSMRVQVAELDKSLHNVLEYTIHGAGANYTIGLNPGVAMTLSSNKSSTCWVLDCGKLDGENIVIEAQAVSISGFRVNLADHYFESMFICKPNGEILKVDFGKKTTFPIKEDAAKYQGGSQKLTEHLNDLSDKHLLATELILVDKYTTPAGQSVGRAFYEPTSKRLLYTIDAPEKLTSSAQVGALTAEGKVFFYNTEHCAIWRVEVSTGVCEAKYHALCPISKRTLERVWVDADNQIHAIFRHRLSNNYFGHLNYILTADRMNLVGMVGSPALLSKLNGLDKWTGEAKFLLEDYYTDPSEMILKPKPFGSLAGADIDAAIDPHMIFVLGPKDEDQYFHHRFWIRMSDRTVIKPHPDIHLDYLLVGTIASTDGSGEQFCFLSHKEHKLVIQRGNGKQAEEPRPVTMSPELGTISNFFCANNNLFSITDAGFILRLTTHCTLALEAVNHQWLEHCEKDADSGPWWTALPKLAKDHDAAVVSIVGLRDAEGSPVQAWLCSGRFVVAGPSLRGKPRHIAGLTEGGSKAWLWHIESEDSGHIYAQPTVRDKELETVFCPKAPFIKAEAVPDGRGVLVEHPFKMVALTEGGLRYTTKDGVVLILASERSARLYGVDKVWQQNRGHLSAELATLVNTWGHGETVVMLGSEPPQWYLTSSGKILAAAKATFTWLNAPTWLGADPSGARGYAYVAAHGRIYELGESSAEEKSAASQEVAFASRFQDVLAVKPSPGESFRQFALENVLYTILSQFEGDTSFMEYVVPSASWESVDGLVIKWKDQGRVEIEGSTRHPRPAGSFLGKRSGDDLIMMEISTGRFLKISRGLVMDPSCVIRFTDKLLTVGNGSAGNK
ncbi:makes caterpillars floppy protein [Epichloe bromicola]|uniref:Makes caterpillars floppy protein n=1 Tax=Epichloe bromicola TaxID=79588 RepID=A0ABQ0CK67_9HYPO